MKPSGQSFTLRALRLATASLIALGAALPVIAEAQAAPAPASAPRAAGQRFDGFIPFTWDASKGRVLMEISLFDQDVLYYVSAATGGGSVELPFDRGIQESSVVHFIRSGNKVLVEKQNLKFRSLTGDAAHAQGVKDSFPSSILAALPVESEAGGKVVVDATPLFMRDAANVEVDLRRTKQAGYKFDASRSGFYTPRMKAFPLNTEIETIATFTAGDAPGNIVATVTPDAREFTMHIHHSFLKAPTGYTPRDADPRIGVGGPRFKDYSKDFDDAIETQWVSRWRLEKKDPSAPMSEPVKPIVYYFDPAIPSPIRTAMKEGLLWWNKAFEAAGFINAIQAKDAPADMDPMDIRYAYVLWINRDERGFSSSGNYSDPRTGEVLGSKSHMDTHRIRSIANYYDAYSGGLPEDGSGVTIADPSLLTPGAFEAMPKGQRDMVLLRQALLTAHELGHTLGFGHNFASSINDRASVMEYPTPRVAVKDGKLDISESFQKAIGAYDTYMVRYSYTPFAPTQEKQQLDAVIEDMRAHGILYVPDSDPRWTWYDDRATPVENLTESMAARKIMLANYGPAMLKPDEPLGTLRDVRLWMAYLHHRYAIESGLKYVGGQFNNIVVKGENLPATEFIPGKEQRDVLNLLMSAIDPDNLALPESLLKQLTTSMDNNLEDLSKDDVFDQLRAARILCATVLEPLFDADRGARMIALASRQPDALTLPEMFDTVMKHTWNASAGGSAESRALLRVSQGVALQSMMIMGGAEDGSPEARAYVLDQLASLSRDLKSRKDGDPLTAAFYRQSARDIDHYLEDPAKNAPKSAMPNWGKGPRSRFPMPPGPPLG